MLEPDFCSETMALRVIETSDRLRIQFVRDWDDDCVGPQSVAERAVTTRKPVLIDFEHLVFITSAIIGQLVVLLTYLRQRTVQLQMCNVSESAKEVFKICRLQQVVPLVEDPDDRQP